MPWNETQEFSGVVHGKPPSKSNNYKMGKGSFYKSDSVKNYEQAFRLQTGRLANLNIDYPFEFHINVWFANKAALDCLQTNKTISNDSLCMHINARKFIDRKQPRIEFMIKKAS